MVVAFLSLVSVRAFKLLTKPEQTSTQGFLLQIDESNYRSDSLDQEKIYLIPLVSKVLVQALYTDILRFRSPFPKVYFVVSSAERT